MIPFCNLQAQYKAYENEINDKISIVLNKCAFIGGEYVKTLEKNLSNYTKSTFVHTCSNGTTALYLALKTLGIKEGDEIITTPFTFIASSEMIALIGAKPVFVDISEEDYNIDISQIKEKITPKTKAILAVSIFGQMPDLKALRQICDENKLYLIEDGAQSFGAKDDENNPSCGNLAHISTTSFFPSKPLGCYGDGGAIFTNDERLSQKLSLLINHGSKERYIHEIIGVNARLDNIQAAVLNVKLKYFDEEIEKRQKIAKIYDENLQNCIIPKIKKGYKSAYAQYSIRVQNREKIVEKLKNADIPTAIHYPMPLHLQPCFKYLGYKNNDLKTSIKVCNEILSLPFCAFLDEKNQEKIIKVFNDE